MKYLHRSQTNGFTLLELLVAMFAFGVVMTIITSAAVQAFQVQRTANNFQVVEENTRFMLESIAKELRVSTITSTDGCSNDISMLMPSGDTITYTFNAISAELLRRENAGSDSSINSNSVQITQAEFCKVGIASGDFLQPRVTIRLSVQSTQTRDQQTMDLQTTVSMRQLQD